MSKKPAGSEQASSNDADPQEEARRIVAREILASLGEDWRSREFPHPKNPSADVPAMAGVGGNIQLSPDNPPSRLEVVLSHLRGRGDRSERVRRQLASVMRAISMRTSDQVAPTPVVLYLENEASYDRVREALDEALLAFDQQIIMASEPVEGSIWRSFVAVFQRQAAPERLEQVGDIATAGAKARWYGEPQSQITQAQSDAIAKLLDSLKDNQNAMLAFSNMLILKIDGTPIVRELTPEQVEHLQKNPALYDNPKSALTVLDVGLTGAHVFGGGDEQRAIEAF